MMRSLLVVCLLAGIAYADSPTGDKTASLAHYEKGKKAYAAGKFDVAVTEFEAAYAAWNAGEYLHDIGQAYRRLGRCNEAASALERYLTAKPQAPNRATVTAQIEALRAKCPLAAAAPAQPPAQPAPSPPAQPAPSPAPTPPAPSSPPAVTQPAPRAAPGPAVATKTAVSATSVTKTTSVSRTPSPWHPAAHVGLAMLDAGPVVMPPVAVIGGGVLRDLATPLPLPLQVGANLSLTRLPYDDQMSGTVWLVGPEAVAATAYTIAPRFAITGALAAGVQLVSGLDTGNPFTTNGEAHGAFLMLRLRGELGVAWRASDRVTVRIAPLGYQVAPRRAPLATDIRALHGFTMHAGVSLDL